MSIDLSFKNTRSPVNGCVLISDPFLNEDFFRRSVVLLCNHDKEEGSFGLVLNNYIELDLHQIDEKFPDINARISVGGPVDTEHLFYIHSFGDRVRNSTLIENDLYFGGDFEQLKLILNEEPESKRKVRFFLGYSGWSKNQLNEELKENSWIVATNITAEDLFETGNDEFWKFCLEKQGNRFKTISKFPLNPNDN